MNPPTRSTLRARIGACGLAAALALLPQAAPAGHDEYAVKAAFIHNFANLITWPKSAFASPSTPLRVAILGPPDFAPDMAAYLEGRKVGPHAIEVGRVSDESQIGRYHIVFVGDPARGRLRRVLEAARGARVLTVGESEGFAAQGGMINFFLEDNKVRFEINRPAAEAAGLKVSSRLLRLAVLVESGG